MLAFNSHATVYAVLDKVMLASYSTLSLSRYPTSQLATFILTA